MIVKREEVDETDFTGEMGHMIVETQTLERTPITKIKVDTPCYTRTIKAMCKKNPLFDLIIGNVQGSRKPNDPNLEWGPVAAQVNRMQTRYRGDPKQLKIKEMTLKWL